MIWQNDPRAILTGGVLIDRKSTPYSDIALPKEVTDPLYTSSQSELNTLGSGLLEGNIPDYYKSIGDFNSPQFQAMINSVKGQIMQGSQEASAINGTGRSGVAITASNNALSSILPQLTYQDFLRAVQGRGALLDTGLNVESGVRNSAQNQQQFDTNFNQTLYQDQIKQAGLIDDYKKQEAQAQGAFYGNIATLVGGQGLGNLVSGGFDASNGVSANGNYSNNSSLSSLFDMLGKIGSSSGGGGSAASYGIADQGLGSFNSLAGGADANGAALDLLATLG